MTQPTSTTIIGVGNTHRSDDGVGIAIARRLQQQRLAGLRILEESGDGAALLEAWKGATAVILLDAVYSGAPPGTIYRFDAHIDRIPSQFFRCSTHAFGVAEAIELARTLNQLPPRLIVYGIEGEKFSAGLGLSVAVEQAASTMVAQVLEQVRQWTVGSLHRESG
jgi:hydrogenase maturation protease